MGSIGKSSTLPTHVHAERELIMKLLFAAALLFGLSAHPVLAADPDQESGMGAAHEQSDQNKGKGKEHREKAMDHADQGKEHMDHGKDKAKGHNEEGMGHGTEHKDMDKEHKGKGPHDKD